MCNNLKTTTRLLQLRSTQLQYENESLVEASSSLMYYIGRHDISQLSNHRLVKIARRGNQPKSFMDESTTFRAKYLDSGCQLRNSEASYNIFWSLLSSSACRLPKYHLFWCAFATGSTRCNTYEALRNYSRTMGKTNLRRSRSPITVKACSLRRHVADGPFHRRNIFRLLLIACAKGV